MQYVIYNMNPTSAKAAQFFLRQISANSTLARAALSATVHGQLGLSVRSLVTPAIVLPQPDSTHGDTSPNRLLLGRLLEEFTTRASTYETKNFLAFIMTVWQRGEGTRQQVVSITLFLYII